MAERLVVKIDDKKLWSTINEADGLPELLDTAVKAVVSNANQSSAGFRTEVIHIDGRRVGGTQPEYGGDVAKKGRTTVGIVHPKNYAAIKDNYINNTMLKSLRSIG